MRGLSIKFSCRQVPSQINCVLCEFRRSWLDNIQEPRASMVWIILESHKGIRGREMLVGLDVICIQLVKHGMGRVTGQNGTGQNGTDKMVRTKWYTDKMVWDKMVWTKWYGQNGTDKMVVIFGIDYNSSEFNSYLVTKSHNEMLNT